MIEEIKDNTIYAFNYNECIYESMLGTISLHYSKEGAEQAMNEHKEKAKKEFDELYSDDENNFGFVFGNMEYWCVSPVKILP